MPWAFSTRTLTSTKGLYGERHLVECFIGKVKRYRRVFTRFEKLSRRYLGFWHFVAALIRLR